MVLMLRIKTTSRSRENHVEKTCERPCGAKKSRNRVIFGDKKNRKAQLMVSLSKSCGCSKLSFDSFS